MIVVPKQLGFGEENTRKIPSKIAILLQGKRDAKNVTQKTVAQSPRYSPPNDHFQARVQNAWGGLPKVTVRQLNLCGGVLRANEFPFLKSIFFSFCLLPLLFSTPFFLSLLCEVCFCVRMKSDVKMTKTITGK